MNDVTNRIRAEEILRQQAALINLAHDAIIVRGPDYRITLWNLGPENTYGWSKEEALGKVPHLLLKTASSVPLEEIKKACLGLGFWEGELNRTRRDGTGITVDSRQILLKDLQGEISAILEINRDITERKKLD